MFLGSNGTETALDTGCGYLTFMGFFFCLIGFKMAVDGLLRGAGDMRMFTVANLANLGIRVAVAMAFAPRYGIAHGLVCGTFGLVCELGDFVCPVPDRESGGRFIKSKAGVG